MALCAIGGLEAAKTGFLRPKQALFDMDECPETPSCGTVDGGGDDAVSQRLNRRKGTNNN
ncbi:MAG: hypothetical protein K5890_01520 [Bacteroidales bacterium]|nr:hypothetical protein [Bacteroidales bacterium]